MVLAGCVSGGLFLAFLAVLAAAVVAFVCIWVPTAAAVLKAACRLAGAPRLDINLAMEISFFESVIAPTLLIVVAGPFATESLTELWARRLAAIVLSAVVSAGIYVWMIRVTFPKGLLIAAARYPVTLSILAIAIAMFSFLARLFTR
jgi:hypothetical protein